MLLITEMDKLKLLWGTLLRPSQFTSYLSHLTQLYGIRGTTLFTQWLSLLVGFLFVVSFSAAAEPWHEAWPFFVLFGLLVVQLTQTCTKIMVKRDIHHHPPAAHNERKWKWTADGGWYRRVSGPRLRRVPARCNGPAGLKWLTKGGRICMEEGGWEKGWRWILSHSRRREGGV